MKRRKRLIILASIIIIAILGAYLFVKLGTVDVSGDVFTVDKNGKELTRNVGSFRYIHIKLIGGSKEKASKYKITDPKNEVIKEGLLDGEVEYEGKCIKGEWKIEINTDQDIKVERDIWCGNLKKKDSIE